MSARSKGMMIERMAQKELEADGWLVQRAPGSTRFSKQVDLFGLFDLICILPDNGEWPSLKRKYIQIKANRKPTREERKKLKWFDSHCCCSYHPESPIDSVEWWVYWNRGKRKSKQGWEKIII